MSLLKNKHVIIAMIVTPVLAIIAYFGVDHVVSEPPQAALQGSSYMLVAKSNCRYRSGLCTLKNGDVDVTLRAQRIDDNVIEFILSSDMPLQSALLSVLENELSSEPVSMQPILDQTNTWFARFSGFDPEKSALRIAINISDTLYYAETTTIFIDYETSFSRENFTN